MVMAGEERSKIQLSRGSWTLARFFAERSPAPVHPVVRAGDDALHVAKLAVAAAVPRAVYVVDAGERLVGEITDRRRARAVFAHLDPGLTLSGPTGGTAVLQHLKENAARLTAGALMEARAQSSILRDDSTLADATRTLYRMNADELPVVDRAGVLIGVVRALDVVREWVEDTLLVHLGDETESFY
jgi:CBS-domain-containing membrane protein